MRHCQRCRSALISVMLVGLLWLAWTAATTSGVSSSSGRGAYAALMGPKAAGSAFPSPLRVWTAAAHVFAHPFLEEGPNRTGIMIQLAFSLARVLGGFTAAALIGIPLGFAIGMSRTLGEALGPFIQILRPISPLAWMPLALYTVKGATASSVFVIFICALWPILLSTSHGVTSVSARLIEVARTLEIGRMRLAFTVILPACAPAIVNGMRISMGIAWLVIVAAEMLVGGTGIGAFVWNSWNDLSLSRVLLAIVLIGLVGMALDAIFARISRAVTFEV